MTLTIARARSLAAAGPSSGRRNVAPIDLDASLIHAANPCSIDESGRLNYAPILYRWEMEGPIVSQAVGLTPTQIQAVLRMARDLAPRNEQEIAETARGAATLEV